MYQKEGGIMTEKQITKLLNSLSLEEKIGEITQIYGGEFINDVEITGEKNSEYTQQDLALCGSTLGVCDPEKIIKIQKKHMENHPHKIPMLFMADIIHGYSTIFPIPLAQGCTFNEELVEKLNRLTAKETAPSGLHVTFSPMVDLARDARWGRVAESYGEDCVLSARLGAAAVRGYQGEDLSNQGTVAACVKHFAAYGAVEGGREYGVVDISERSLRQDYLPSYKAACEADCAMLMSAFNAIGGDPASGSEFLLKDILRDEWSWQGTVISDWSSVYLMKSHGISADDAVLAQKAVKGRLAIEMCSSCYKNGIKTLLDSGRITTEELDRLVLDVLNLKNKLGLFENPYRFADKEALELSVNCEETRKAAAESVCEASVLLKNEGILPLQREEKIAFIGPYVNNPNILGMWVIGGIDRPQAQTVQSALEEKYPQNSFSFCQGSKIYGTEQAREVEFFSVAEDMEADPLMRERLISEAVETAKSCDKVVMLLGEHVRAAGELAAKAHITLPHIQTELFRRVSRVNQNIVTVLFNQRPLDICEIAEGSKALLDIWFPGTMGAKALTEMLFGESAPTGRLAMSFPYTVGQCPIYYNQLPTDHSAEYQTHFATGYADCPNTPYYAFGQGITYTDFAYGELELEREEIGANEALQAKIKVTNTGARDGFETVQLYIRDMEASVSRPLKELKDFKKIFIKAGETVEVAFEITPESLKIYDINMNYVAEKGTFRVFIGHDSLVNEYKTFTLK